MMTQISTSPMTMNRRGFLALVGVGAAAAGIGCGSTEPQSHLHQAGVQPLQAQLMQRFGWQHPMAILNGTHGDTYGVNAPTIGEINVTSYARNSIFNLQSPDTAHIIAQPNASPMATGRYIQTAQHSGEQIVLLVNGALLYVTPEWHTESLPWTTDHDIAGGLLVDNATGSLFVTSSKFDRSLFSATRGILQKFATDEQGRPAPTASQTIDLSNLGDNPTSMALTPDGLWVLISGNPASPSPKLVQFDKNSLSVVQTIDLPGSRVAQTSNTLALDPSQRFAFIGTNDYSGEVWRVDLKTGQVTTRTLNPQAGFHASVIYSGGKVLVSSHDDGMLYVLDPESMKTLQSLSFTENLGPAVLDDAQRIIQLTQGAAYLIG